MDLVVLRRLLAELSGKLEGQRIEQVYALPRHHLAVVLGSRGAPRLWFSAEPDQPHVYLRPGGHESPQRPPAFAMAARKWLRGQRLAALELVGDDRVVRLRASGPGACLIYELVPRRACAYLVPADGTVAAVWNPRRGRPEPGDPYEPPERRPRTPVNEVDETTWRRLESADDDRALISGLLRTVAGMSGLVAREVAARQGAGTPVRVLAVEELERAATAPSEPRIYAPSHPDELRTPPADRDFLVAPYPLRQADHLRDVPCPDLEAAAAALYTTRARLRMLEGVRAAISAAARSRTASLRRARQRIDRSGSEPGDADALRRQADLLLACPGAPVDDGAATVPDIHGDGSPVRVPVDPARSLVDNAQRYYRKARRAERRVARDRARKKEIDAELERLDTLAGRAGELADAEDCRRLLRAAQAAGLDVDPARLREPEAESTLQEPGAAPKPGRGAERTAVPGVRRFRSPGGHRILVGRSAAGNDRLTHRVAAREDWWLHAQGPGSHVVLRNPQRHAAPPRGPLLLAAAVAAWFSRARKATKVEVNWTRVRHVKRPKGGTPGLVLLESHQTVLVEPRSPEALGLTEEP